MAGVIRTTRLSPRYQKKKKKKVWYIGREIFATKCHYSGWRPDSRQRLIIDRASAYPEEIINTVLETKLLVAQCQSFERARTML